MSESGQSMLWLEAKKDSILRSSVNSSVAVQRRKGLPGGRFKSIIYQILSPFDGRELFSEKAVVCLLKDGLCKNGGASSKSES